MSTTKTLPHSETALQDPFSYHVAPPSPFTAADMVGPPFWHTRHSTNDPFYIKDSVRMMVTMEHIDLVVATRATLSRHFDLLTSPSPYRAETSPFYGSTLGISQEQTIVDIDETVLAGTGYEKSHRCIPDLALLLPSVDIPRNGNLRYQEDTVVWVMEFTSPTTKEVDWKDKKILYARMGIAEYWIQDRARDGSIQISVFRLVQGATPAENIYPQDPVVAQEGGCPSAVLGTRLRMAESGLQLWDQVRDRWMDAGQWQAAEAVEREATVKAEGRDEGRDEGAAEELGNMAAFYTSTRFGDAVRRHAVQMPPGTRPTVLQLMLAARQLPADASAADHERNFMQFLDMQPARTDTDAPLPADRAPTEAVPDDSNGVGC